MNSNAHGHVGHVDGGEHEHATPSTYVKIGVVLGIVTLVEFSALYVQGLAGVLVPLLLLLSAAKFALVAMYYMHLKFDQRLLSGLFVSGIFVAIAIAIALLALFHHLFV
ncbi:MAG TPA: cytochrome C oxidase subunit IV family protein [Chloroflexota bacterium]